MIEQLVRPFTLQKIIEFTWFDLISLCVFIRCGINIANSFNAQNIFVFHKCIFKIVRIIFITLDFLLAFLHLFIRMAIELLLSICDASM